MGVRWAFQSSQEQQLAWKMNAFLRAVLRDCWRMRVAIAIEKNFKQLILHAWLNRVG